jgi:hypothetical protein
MASPLSINLEVLERNDTYVIAAWRRLFLLLWLGKPSVAGIERSRILFDGWAKNHPKGAAFLIVVPPEQSGAPDEKIRQAMQRTSLSPSGQLKGMATLFQAEGFIAAAVRSAMTRLNILREKDATNLFGTVAAAAAWAAALLNDPELSAADLKEAIWIAQRR